MPNFYRSPAIQPVGIHPLMTSSSILYLLDLIGVVVFAISGAQIAHEAGLPWISVVLMGTITGAAGGVIRDVLCAEIPLILRRDIYATAALAGGGLYVLLQTLSVADLAATLAGMATVLALRFSAIFWGWRLPVFRLRDEA